MPPHPLDPEARTVLDEYPFVLGAPALLPLGNRGGFSGARLWQVQASGGRLCLRAWPPGEPAPARLQDIHRCMRSAREAGLSFVPPVFATRGGATWVAHSGRLWDVTGWMPGRADFHERPSRARLECACRALAQLHVAWAASPTPTGPCPSVRRRLDCAQEWTTRVAAGWNPPALAAADDPVSPWTVRAWQVLPPWIDHVFRALAPWAARPLPLQPCMCDVWHDHLLFTGDTVTGLVDFGGVKIDNVAIDLARLLGSLIGDDSTLRAAGLQAYSAVRPMSAEEEELVATLDRTGTILGVANWLLWLYHEGRHFDDRHAVARRLAELVERIERWERRR
jgi:Ser/Thr protein kinase RdoA (MazF antagonist)